MAKEKGKEGTGTRVKYEKYITIKSNHVNLYYTIMQGILCHLIMLFNCQLT